MTSQDLTQEQGNAPDAPPESQPSESNGSRRHSPRTGQHLLNLGVIVAIAGLLFSGITYLFNRHDQQRADKRAARTELTNVLTQLDGIDREYASVPVPNDPEDPSAVQRQRQGLANTERLPLVLQAEQIFKQNPSIFGAADYLSLGYAQMSLGGSDNLLRARDYNVRAEEQATAQNARYLVTAARINLGRVDYLLQDFRRGSATFRALLHERAGAPATVTDSQAGIALEWLRAASVIGSCDSYGDLKEAKPLLPPPYANRLGAALAQCARAPH